MFKMFGIDNVFGVDAMNRAGERVGAVVHLENRAFPKKLNSKKFNIATYVGRKCNFAHLLIKSAILQIMQLKMQYCNYVVKK